MKIAHFSRQNAPTAVMSLRFPLNQAATGRCIARIASLSIERSAAPVVPATAAECVRCMMPLARTAAHKHRCRLSQAVTGQCTAGIAIRSTDKVDKNSLRELCQTAPQGRFGIILESVVFTLEFCSFFVIIFAG